jgi:hypothetical protein
MKVNDNSLEVYDWISKLSKFDIEKYVDYLCSITNADKTRYVGINIDETIVDKTIQHFPETKKMSANKGYYLHGLQEITTIYRFMREGSKKSVIELTKQLKEDSIKRDKILFKYLKKEGRKEAKTMKNYYEYKTKIYESMLKERSEFII